MVGALAGLIASIPMAGVMMGLNRVLPHSKRSWYQRFTALPPKQITMRMGRRAGVGSLIRPGKAWDAATWAGHLGYGAAAASLYPITTRPLPLPGVIRGMIFALGVWSFSYMGWLPATHILPPAAHQPLRRTLIMISSHLVWGALIGLLADRLTDLSDPAGG